ncbi:MAG: hypothetical protein PHR35_20895 [Kiritimatiellae bacterium]|nr:hypothetical protein [Kiritimatiellia bacterium]
MANTKALDFGWFFLRLAIGLIFLWTGIRQFDAGHIRLQAIAALLAGACLIVGLLVRPAVLLMLATMVAVYVTRTRFSVNLTDRSLTDLLALTGFLIGGGGSFLALGAALGGLKGKWYQ